MEREDYPVKYDALELVEDVDLLPITLEVGEIVQAYIKHRVMPNDPVGDSLHLALASYYKCDFLLTWNCMHLANANKFDHIRCINTLLGLFGPALVTPLELLGVSRVRKARHKVSAEHEHEPKRVVIYYMERQQDRERVATDPGPEKEG